MLKKKTDMMMVFAILVSIGFGISCYWLINAPF